MCEIYVTSSGFEEHRRNFVSKIDDCMTALSYRVDRVDPLIH